MSKVNIECRIPVVFTQNYCRDNELVSFGTNQTVCNVQM